MAKNAQPYCFALNIMILPIVRYRQGCRWSWKVKASCAVLHEGRDRQVPAFFRRKEPIMKIILILVLFNLQSGSEVITAEFDDDRACELAALRTFKV